jgi:UDP-N-acetylglucosamine:LPS N-acetylglucosamine transferase
MNAQVLAAAGAARLADSAAGAVAQADRLLCEPHTRSLMRQAALRAARPNAAALIADRIINIQSVTQYASRITPHVDHPSLSIL